MTTPRADAPYGTGRTANMIDLSYSSLDLAAAPSDALIVQCLWTGTETPPAAWDNLSRAVAAGRRVAGYMTVNPDQLNLAMVHASAPAGALDALLWLAVDCEYYDPLPASIVRRESDAIFATLRKPRVLYTSRSYWQRVLSDDQSFGDHLLWDAHWAGTATPFVPYGGWTSRAAVQYDSGQQMGTMNVDLSLAEPELLMASTPPSDTSNIASQEARLRLAAAAMQNDMTELCTLLSYFGVLPAGAAPLKGAV